MPLATRGPRVARALLACTLLATASGVRPVLARTNECAPPRTLLALLPLADRTDGSWALWSGESPALLVGRLLADSLGRARGRRVLRLPTASGLEPGAWPARAADDEPALRAARRAHAEVVVSGTVSVFTHEDTRESGRLARWGVGAPDARSHVRIAVTLRVLDASDGSVIIETSASRDRVGRGTASVSQHDRGALTAYADPLADQVLSEVLGDLASTIGQRLDASWQARVLLERRGIVVLDAGSARGLFAGERLDVWRPGIQMLDEDLVHLGNAARIGSLIVLGFDGHGLARARLAEGEARMGDLVRPCGDDTSPALSLRR